MTWTGPEPPQKQATRLGKILVYAQCPSCPLPFCPSEMPFPLDDLSFNALYQNTILEMAFWNCPFFKMPFLVDLSFNALHQNAHSEMPFSLKCPFQKCSFSICPYQIDISQERIFFIF